MTNRSIADSADGSDGWSRGAPVERHWLVVGSYAFRAMALVPPTATLVADRGQGAAPAVLVVAVVATACAVAAIRVRPEHLRSARRLVPLLLVDTAVAASINLWAGSTLNQRADETPFGLFWPLMQGAVTLWLAVVGVAAAVALVAVGAVVLLGMLALSPVESVTQSWPLVVAYVGWLVLALSVGYAVRRFLRSRARQAHHEGLSAGVEVERARTLRVLHDTALQGFDGIAVLASATGVDPGERLAAIARTARHEAAEMRRIIDPAGRRNLIGELAAAVAGERTRGAPVTLVRHGPVGDVPADVEDACLGAVREALTNARQHAHARSVVVDVRSFPGGLDVRVEDDGVGFTPAVTVGFGLRQSIVTRVEEVGGRASVDSRPGVGTRIRLAFRWQASVAAPSPRGARPVAGRARARRRRPTTAAGRPAALAPVVAEGTSCG
jgi:signal transduction histidine kinase